jgi:hypothetical protein
MNRGWRPWGLEHPAWGVVLLAVVIFLAVDTGHWWIPIVVAAILLAMRYRRRG